MYETGGSGKMCTCSIQMQKCVCACIPPLHQLHSEEVREVFPLRGRLELGLLFACPALTPWAEGLLIMSLRLILSLSERLAEGGPCLMWFLCEKAEFSGKCMFSPLLLTAALCGGCYSFLHFAKEMLN